MGVSKHGIPTLNYNDSVTACVATLEDGMVPVLMGPPGIGKTALMNAIAAKLGLLAVQLIGREFESFELSGVLDVHDGKLDRHLIGPARLMCEKPCLGMFDELTASSAPVFAQMAKILHERRFGDRDVHPGTMLMAAANPQAQSLDAANMPLPLINRLRIFFMQPKVSEVQTYFAKLGEDGSMLRLRGQELAAILDARPELLQLDVNAEQAADCMDNNLNWASPRSWERAIRTLARPGPTLPLNILKACLTGDLGPGVADMFLAIRNTYAGLPNVREIVENPKKAKMPKDFLHGVGVLSLLPTICAEDPCAGWVYADRIKENVFTGGQDTRIALATTLGRVGHMSDAHFKNSEFAEEARIARVALSAETNRVRGRV